MAQSTGPEAGRNKPFGLPIERCNQAEPIIAPGTNWWETGVTFNASAIYLERSPENDPLIRGLLPMRRLEDPDLADGVVAIHYRARPEVDPASAFGRSFIGLAAFTPSLRPLYRYQEPVIYPCPDPQGYDHLGVEDPRVTRFGDTFYMIYCGVAADARTTYRARLCAAQSTDLLHWEKLGPLAGDLNQAMNKDGVLFPDKIDGAYWLLHRPYAESLPLAEYAIRLASSQALSGPWQDRGELLRAYPNPRYQSSWVGAGSVPIPVGEKQFIEIYHTGNYRNASDREYDLDAALLDFNQADLNRPETLVTARLEPLMVPETPAELRSHSHLQVSNVLFACGSYEYQGWIYIIYGGADTYTLAARVRKEALTGGLKQADLHNPFAP